MRRRLIWILVALLMLGSGVAALRLAKGGTAGAAIATKYAFGTVAQGSLHETVTGSGTVTAGTTADVYPAVAGTVATVDAAVGETVTKGQVLATLTDNGSLRSELDNARVQLRRDEASLTALLRPTPTAAEVTAAENQVSEDQAKLEADAAASEAAQAVLAPISGEVLAVDLANGGSAAAGQDLLEIGSSGSWVIDATIDQVDLQEVYKGEGGEATGTGLNGTLPVYVASISPTSSGSDRGGATYPVVLAVEGTAGGLKAGEQVTVSLPGSYLTLSGTVAYQQTAEVTAPIAGTVTGLSLAVGDSVQQGETLLSVESSSESLTLMQDEDALTSAKASLAALTAGDAPDSTAVLSAEATVSSDEEAIAQDALSLSELTLTSPMSGEVTAVNVTAGNAVSAGGTAAFTIENVRELTVAVSVDERYVREIKAGEAAAVTSQAASGQTFQGRVVSVAPVGSDSQGVSTFTVDVALERSGSLLPGMAASVTIDVTKVADALLIPAEAVTGSGARASVKELVRGKVVRRPIVAGLSNGVFTEVLSGLRAGERVITATAVSTTVQTRRTNSGGMKLPTGGPPSGGSAPSGSAPPTGGQ